jgi:transaldolase
MVAQARVITTWGKNVYVKLPVTNTRGETLFDAVARSRAKASTST